MSASFTSSQPSTQPVSTSESTGSSIGLNSSPVSVGGDGGVSIDPAVNADTQSDATAVTGSVNSLSYTDAAAGIRTSDVQVGGQATVSGSVLANTSSASLTTSGYSQARSILGDPSAEVMLPDFYAYTPSLTSAFSTNLFDAVGGIVNRDGSIVAGGNGSVNGAAGTAAAPTSTSASAASTTGESQSVSLVPTQFGISLDKLSIGSSGSVVGSTFSNQGTASSTKTGSSTSQTLNLQSAGLRVSDASGSYDSSGNWTIDSLPFTIGDNGNIVATSKQKNTAASSTVTGGSVAQVGGIPPLGSMFLPFGSITTQFATGASLPGSVEPAFLNSLSDSSGNNFVSALASSLDPSGAPLPPIPSGARIGGDLALDASASLHQASSALATSGDASASATGSNLLVDPSGAIAYTGVNGLTGNLSVHANGSTDFDAAGSLMASSQAMTTTGDAFAINGNEVDVPNPNSNGLISTSGSSYDQPVSFPSSNNLPLQFNEVTGIGSGLIPSHLTIGSSLRNGASFEGNANLEASSETTTGNAFTSNAARSFGSKGVTLDIGQNIEGRSASFLASATADTSAKTTTAGTEGSLAQTQLQAAGFNGSPLYSGVPLNAIEVGGNGNLDFAGAVASTTSASAVSAGTTSPKFSASGNVGVKADSSVVSAGYAPTSFGFLSPIYGNSVDNYDPETYFQPQYGTYSSSNNLFIGGSGSVDAESFAQSQTSALNVSGGVEAFSQNASTGILLEGNNVTIGDTGNVRGVAYIAPSSTSASTRSGTAEAASTSFGNGIFSTPPSMDAVVAGPNGGSVTGAVLSSPSVTSASSVSGDVKASNDGSMAGLSGLRISAGQLAGTGSSINGSSRASFETKSSTTTGDSTSMSDASSVAIFQSKLSVNGNVNALSELVNTTLASSVTGNTVAQSTGSSIGLDHSSVHILDSGSVNASANSTVSSISQTVTGNSMAYA
jgi:hypothetical protein